MPTVDLDRYREPSRSPEVLAARRGALAEQMEWLADEAAALGPLLAALPTWAVEQAPLPEERSVRQSLAALAALDRSTHPAWLDAVEAAGRDGEPPRLAMPDLSAVEAGAVGEPADGDLGPLLAEVRAAREALVARVRGLAPDVWERPVLLDGRATDLYGVLLALVRRDADELKALAYRLHGADLTQRTR